MIFSRILLALCLTLALWSDAAGQSSSLGTGIVSTNSIQTCGPATGTLTAANQEVKLDCAGASNFLIQITGNFAGTIASSDSVTGGGRRFVKTGVAPLEQSSEALSGSQGNLEYRTVGGGYGQSIKATAYTSGTANVTILGVYNQTTGFINGEVHTAEEVAIRQGRAYTLSTGTRDVATNNFLSLQITNPTGSNERAYITTRAFGCNPTGTVLEFAGVSNPTTNLATSAVTMTNRRAGGPATALTGAVATATTHPDTATAAVNPPGGFVPAGGGAAYLGPEFTRTLEPGNSFVNWIGGSGGGLTATARCYMTFVFYTVPIN